MAEVLPCPPDYVAGFMLVALAALIGRKRRIRLTSTWVEQAVMWLLVVARSGARKTPAFNIAFGPLRAIQKSLVNQYRQDMKAWADLPPNERSKEPKPRLRQVLTTSFTIEALNGLLADNPDVCVTADEGVGPLLALNQYKAGRGDDRTQLLSLWSGQDVVVNRKEAEPILITDPVVNFAGGVQPDVLGKVVGAVVEDGLPARFLFVYPPRPSPRPTGPSTTP